MIFKIEAYLLNFCIKIYMDLTLFFLFNLNFYNLTYEHYKNSTCNLYRPGEL